MPSPSTPKRPSFHIRGLSLQMPSKEPQEDASNTQIPRIPLSPKLDSSHIYGSPASMLPRRSRGLDYTRACTNLHLSTLAESSPDVSPVTSRSIQIPSRRSLGNTVLDSPSNMSSSMWSANPERTALSSSVSSVNMLDSDSETTSSDDMAIDRDEDPMLNTPAASKMNSNFITGVTNSPGMEWMNPQPSPAQASLLNIQPSFLSFRRARAKKGKSHNSSSSVSLHSTKPSPGPLSPPILKSVEGSSYFGPGLTRQQVQSRRESLSLGTNDLHLSDSEDNDNKYNNPNTSMDASHPEGPRGVIRRAVTRRSNLLPKPKGLSRIKAALAEESAPVETEVFREAQVIRQVHENDPTIPDAPPTLQASTSLNQEPIEASIEDGGTNQDTSAEARTSISSETFSRHAERNSAGLGFWHAFDDRYRTPPPTLLPRESSSAMSDEAMDTPGSSLFNTGDNPAWRHLQRSRSRSTTPLAAQSAPTAQDVARKVNNKRRRDDDFDPSAIKRRAVSPGMSVQSSPVMPQSPVLTSDKSWGKPPPKVNGHGDRSNSGGSSSSGMKKVGLVGMTETNDGLMSMSID